jgi:hypothetical protein
VTEAQGYLATEVAPYQRHCTGQFTLLHGRRFDPNQSSNLLAMAAPAKARKQPEVATGQAHGSIPENGATPAVLKEDNTPRRTAVRARGYVWLRRKEERYLRPRGGRG